MSGMTRILLLRLENEVICDGDFVGEVAHSLREYADALDAGASGLERTEIITGPRGTTLHATSFNELRRTNVASKTVVATPS